MTDARRRFLAASRTAHRGRHCATCTQFYTEHGVVHPIRNSPGYSKGVEEIQAENREHHRLASIYGHERQERGASVVVRPPWSAGISESNLLTIARAHGVHASQEGWWEDAGLYKGMGELRSLLREGGHKGDTRKMAARTAERLEPAPKRYKRPEALPW
jgi:hypothetical protein